MSDLIRREDVLDAFEKICILCGTKKREPIMCKSCYLDDAICIVDEIPSAEPEKWIPVTEALPKDMDRILTTIVRSDGEKRVRSGHYYKGYFMMDNGDTWNETDKEVIAWMPLIEPYRGEE